MVPRAHELALECPKKLSTHAWSQTVARLDMPWVVGSWSTETLPDLAKLAREVNRQAAMIGYINAFYLFSITAAVAVPLAFLLRDVPRSG